MERHNKEPEKREAQKVLAYEFVKDLHGKEEADMAKKKSEELFGKKSSENLEVEESTLKVGSNILDILVDVKIAPSKSEARRLVTQGGITVDEEKIVDPNTNIDKDVFVIQKGKKTFKKVHLN